MRKKRGRAKKIPMVMKPKITLKVAKAVDNESASFSEASLGRSDWEWKPEEDASSVESGSSADHDSSSGNERGSQYWEEGVLHPLQWPETSCHGGWDG